jgi:hypothetical protein
MWAAYGRPIVGETALVQLCDDNKILLIQVSAMKSRFALLTVLILCSHQSLLRVPTESQGEADCHSYHSNHLRPVTGCDRVPQHCQNGCKH